MESTAPDITSLTTIIDNSGIDTTLLAVGGTLVSVAVLGGLIMMVVNKLSQLGRGR